MEASRALSVTDWRIRTPEPNICPDDCFSTLMARVAAFHAKHDFEHSGGHDMGFRLSLTIEELGEFSAAITKGHSNAKIAAELADVVILCLGHALALEVDLEHEIHRKLDVIMQRESKQGHLGKRVTDG